MQIEKIQPKAPVFSDLNVPDWYHFHGNKLKAKIEQGTLVIKSKTTTVRIRQTFAEDCCAVWNVEYHILHSLDNFSSGNIVMTQEDFKSAFGISEDCDHLFGQHIINRFGGNVACQGKYIRFGDFLNIPCPGTGCDGDPNVSINLDPEVRKIVSEFVRDVELSIN